MIFFSSICRFTMWTWTTTVTEIIPRHIYYSQTKLNLILNFFQAKMRSKWKWNKLIFWTENKEFTSWHNNCSSSLNTREFRDFNFMFFQSVKIVPSNNSINKIKLCRKGKWSVQSCWVAHQFTIHLKILLPFFVLFSANKIYFSFH